MIEINGLCDSATNIRSYFPEVDIFISGISTEERFLKGYSLLLDNNIQPNHKVLFYYRERFDNYRKIEQEDSFDISFQINKNDKKLKVSLYDEMAGLLLFKKYVDENSSFFNNKKIIIDISTMVEPYFLLLLKHLSMIETERIGFIYTEPGFYAGLTKGTVATQDLPGFSGKKTLNKREALAILLGFEGNRAMTVSNEINPELTIPINGFPSFQPKFKDKSIIENKELLKDELIFKNLKFAPAYDPFETKTALSEIYDEYSSEFNLSLAPLGSKPMALGSGFFALEHSECRIIYPYPKEYFENSSKGVRNCWLYVTEIRHR